MKMNKIAVACALAVSAIGAHAASAVSGHTVVFFSGASAPDKFLSDISTSVLSGAVAYKGVEADGTVNGNYNAFVGTANGIPGVTNGTKIAIIKRSEGGSERGVGPVGQKVAIRTMDLTNCDLTAKTCALTGDDAAGTGMIPDMGVSDLEPAMFVGLGKNVPLDGAETPANLFAEVKPVNQLIFGLVATNSIPATTHFSRVGYGNLLSGKYQTWNEYDASLTGAAAEENVVICRRVAGSGTQASYNMYFNNFPCGSERAASTPIADMNSWDAFGAYVGGSGSQADPIQLKAENASGLIVLENSGSGDVRNCLKAANNNSTYTFKSNQGVWFSMDFSSTAGKPFRAIGVLSADSYGKESGWAFRMLDGAGTFNLATQTASAGATGVAPSKANLVSGKYDFVLESSFQHAGLTGVKKAVFDEIVKRAGSTTYTGDTTGTFTTVPNAFATLPQIGDAAAQPTLVSRFTRQANSCAPLQKF